MSEKKTNIRFQHFYFSLWNHRPETNSCCESLYASRLVLFIRLSDKVQYKVTFFSGKGRKGVGNTLKSVSVCLKIRRGKKGDKERGETVVRIREIENRSGEREDRT